MVSFDRKGRCPLCRKDFRSAECKHSHDYVMQVLSEVERRKSQGNVWRDAARLMGKHR